MMTVAATAIQTAQLKKKFTAALSLYHRLNREQDGSPLSGIQYPPFIQSGDKEGLSSFVEKLSDYLSSDPGITFVKSPPLSEDAKRWDFREKLARIAQPEVSANVRREFDNIVESIESQPIKAFVKEALAWAPKEFFTASSGNTYRFHPADEAGAGGLLLHTIRDVIMGRKLATYFNLPQEKTDEISAALILHDVQKGGIPWNGVNMKHGPIAGEWLKQFSCENSGQKEAIIREVTHHMAQWNQPKPTPPATLEEQLVSYADYLASLDDVYVGWRS